MEAGLPISPLMDRTKEGITRSQPGVRGAWRGGEVYIFCCKLLSTVPTECLNPLCLRWALQFFTIVALPMFQSFCTVFPDCRPMLDAAKENFVM